MPLQHNSSPPSIELSRQLPQSRKFTPNEEDKAQIDANITKHKSKLRVNMPSQIETTPSNPPSQERKINDRTSKDNVKLIPKPTGQRPRCAIPFSPTPEEIAKFKRAGNQ